MTGGGKSVVDESKVVEEEGAGCDASRGREGFSDGGNADRSGRWRKV